MKHTAKFVNEVEALAFAKMHAFNGVPVMVIPANAIGADTVVQWGESTDIDLAVNLVVDILDGPGVWNSETCESIADVFRDAGFNISKSD